MTKDTVDKGRHLVRVRLENFQDHKCTDIPLESGINLIIGSSDAGKSAILRAISFVLHNQPRGNDFVRWGTDEARVTLWFSDGVSVQRIKGEKTNSVIVRTKDDPIGDKYDKFGNELPEAVRKALGFPPADERNGPISYADQMAPLFLVSQGASDLPRTLSELTGISALQEAAEELGRRARAFDKQIKDLNQRVENHNLQLIAYEDLDERIEELDTQEQQFQQIEALEEKCLKMRDCLERYREIVTEGKQEAARVSRARNIASLSNRLEPVVQQREQLDSARSLLHEYEELEAEIAEHESALTYARKLQSPEYMDRVNRSKELIDFLTTARGKLKEYQGVVDEGKQVRKQYDDWKEKQSQLVIEKASIIEQMQEAGLWCERCDRPVVKGEDSHHD